MFLLNVFAFFVKLRQVKFILLSSHVHEKKAGLLMVVQAGLNQMLHFLEIKNVVCWVLVFLAEFLGVFVVKSSLVFCFFADATLDCIHDNPFFFFSITPG